MSTAPALPSVPVEEYLKTSYEPNCEYLDGHLVPKAMPDYIHSVFQNLLMLFFASQKDKFPGLRGLQELHIRISPNRFRVPDIAGLTAKPADGRYPDRQTPPLFTIEIVSLDEPLHTLKGKVADHLKMGVAVVILADPYDRTIMVASQTEPLHVISAPLTVDIPYSEGQVLQIDFDDLYCKLDRELNEE